MNEVAVKTALRDLIVDNQALLLNGIIHQGVQREIAQIALSNLTPPQGYYYILIYITEARESSQVPVAQNVRQPRSQTIYPVQIEITDQAQIQTGETEAYEVMHNDFDLFGDRLVKLIRTQTWIGNGPKFELQRVSSGDTDRSIVKRNLSGTFVDTEGTDMALLHATLNFNLIQKCSGENELFD